MGKVLVVVLVMVLSTAIAQFRSDQYLFKSEPNTHIKETANLWTHAFENDIMNGLTNQGFGSKQSKTTKQKNNIQFPFGSPGKKSYNDYKVNYDVLKTLLKTTVKDIVASGLKISSKPVEAVSSEKGTTVSNYEMPLSANKLEIWGGHSYGLDSGMLGIGAIDMGHGLREFGLV